MTRGCHTTLISFGELKPRAVSEMPSHSVRGCGPPDASVAGNRVFVSGGQRQERRLKSADQTSIWQEGRGAINDAICQGHADLL